MNSILACLALALFAGFLAIIGSFVPEPDLLAVFAITIALCAIDFFRELTGRKSGK